MNETGVGSREAVVAGAEGIGAILMPCPFCGAAAKYHCGPGSKPDVVWHVVECPAELSCGASPSTIGLTREEAVAAWNTRSGGRTEFTEILARLVQRGVITAEDADRMGVGSREGAKGAKEVDRG